MTTYSVRIFDGSTERFLFTAPNMLSPFRAGQVVAGACAALIRRDGHQAADLELRSCVLDPAGPRPLSQSEEAAMNSAFQEAIAALRDDLGLKVS